MKIVHTPADILHLRAEPVTHFDSKLKKIVSEMITTLNRQKNPEGVGLAAPQVGISKQIFIVKPESKSVPSVFVNAKIVTSDEVRGASKKQNNSKPETRNSKQSKTSKIQLEGCLSIPKIWGEVTRPQQVNLAWQDENGDKHEAEFNGFEAVVIQHEIDHLNGVLFTSHVIAQKQPLYREENGELIEFEI